MGLLIRLFAFLFNLALGLALFFLTLLVMGSRVHNIDQPFVPLSGRALTYTLFAASIYVFVAMVLALRRGGGTRLPLLLWNALLPVLLVRPVVGGAVTFRGLEHFTAGLWFLVAALLALLGAWLQWRAGRRRAKRSGR